MGLSKNTLDRSDISTYPIKLKYSASYASSSAYSYGITLNRGINGSFNSNGEDFLVYKLAKQLYYNLYLTGSLNNSASYWNDNLQSTAASGTFDNDYRYFPNAADDQITLMAIPRNVFGENISRKSLRISGATYNLIDDGNGNIIDTNNSNTHVGNVLYSQGIVIITNLDYEYALIDTPIPTTSTTSTTTTAAPTTTTTSTTSTTTTAAPTTTTSTTTTTTTAEPTTTTSTTTTTTTAEPTTTTTSTTTTTTTVAQITVNLYANQEGIPDTLDFHISYDGGSNWSFVGASFNNTTCPGSPSATFNLDQNQANVQIRMGDPSDINVSYRANRSTVTCPAYADGSAACAWPITTSSNITYYFTADVQNGSGCP